MNQQDLEDIIKSLDNVKDILVGVQIGNGSNPNKDVGRAIYELKQILDKLSK